MGTWPVVFLKAYQPHLEHPPHIWGMAGVYPRAWWVPGVFFQVDKLLQKRSPCHIIIWICWTRGLRTFTPILALFTAPKRFTYRCSKYKKTKRNKSYFSDRESIARDKNVTSKKNTTIWVLPSVTSPTKLPDRPTLPAAWPLEYFEDPQPDPRVFWGPATRRRFKNIEWWLITESAQKRKQKQNEKKQYLEKPRRFKLIPGNEKKENKVILTKHKFHH